MLSAALALVGAIIYGAADFLGGLAARRLRSIVVTAVAAASGLVLLVLALPLVGARGMRSTSRGVSSRARSASWPSPCSTRAWRSAR
jgi:hypothetical protein